jgi:hypothetical protein
LTDWLKKFRTYFDDDRYVVTVEIGVGGGGISYVKVFPSRESYTDSGANLVGLPIFTGGLCGQWAEGQVNPINCDLFYRSSGQVVCMNYGQETDVNFVNYWRLKTFVDSLQPSAKSMARLEASKRKKSAKRSRQIDRIGSRINELQAEMNVYHSRSVNFFKSLSQLLSKNTLKRVTRIMVDDRNR